jgi:hypothetical protein
VIGEHPLLSWSVTEVRSLPSRHSPRWLTRITAVTRTSGTQEPSTARTTTIRPIGQNREFMEVTRLVSAPALNLRNSAGSPIAARVDFGSKLSPRQLRGIEVCSS